VVCARGGEWRCEWDRGPRVQAEGLSSGERGGGVRRVGAVVI
jgi:hypothetical protein